MMRKQEVKRFRFTLETLLRLRSEKEQECAIALAGIAGELHLIDKNIESVRSDATRAFAWKIETKDDLLARDRIFLKSVNDLNMLEKARNKAEERHAVAKSRYEAAHIQKKALDNIKDKRKNRWRHTFRREQFNRLDEVAMGLARKASLMGEQR